MVDAKAMNVRVDFLTCSGMALLVRLDIGVIVQAPVVHSSNIIMGVANSAPALVAFVA